MRYELVSDVDNERSAAAWVILHSRMEMLARRNIDLEVSDRLATAKLELVAKLHGSHVAGGTMRVVVVTDANWASEVGDDDGEVRSGVLLAFGVVWFCVRDS